MGPGIPRHVGNKCGQLQSPDTYPKLLSQTFVALIECVICSYAIKKKDEVERVAKANR